MMVTMQEAIASLTGIPRRINKGTKILAPPKPVRAPRKPTGAEMRRRETMFSIKSKPQTNKILPSSSYHDNLITSGQIQDQPNLW